LTAILVFLPYPDCEKYRLAAQQTMWQRVHILKTEHNSAHLYFRETRLNLWPPSSP